VSKQEEGVHQMLRKSGRCSRKPEQSSDRGAEVPERTLHRAKKLKTIGGFGSSHNTLTQNSPVLFSFLQPVKPNCCWF